jgi:hypothetical protein
LPLLFVVGKSPEAILSEMRRVTRPAEWWLR